MKDSQQKRGEEYAPVKYIKESNERFSTWSRTLGLSW